MGSVADGVRKREGERDARERCMHRADGSNRKAGAGRAWRPRAAQRTARAPADELADHHGVTPPCRTHAGESESVVVS